MGPLMQILRNLYRLIWLCFIRDQHDPARAKMHAQPDEEGRTFPIYGRKCQRCGTVQEVRQRARKV